MWRKEQFDDAIGPVGSASDVYSFALVLMESMADRSVNDGQNLGEFLAMAIDPNRRPTPRTLGIAVSDEVQAVFDAAGKGAPSPMEREVVLEERDGPGQ